MAFKKLGIPIIAVVIGISVFVWMSSSKAIAPEISFKDIDGQQHQLSDYKGQPVLMVFWATDCPGCIEEMPDMIALHNEYADKGLKIIGVAMSYDQQQHILSMREKKQLPYLITWDKSGEISKAFNNVRVTPTHFMISPEGEIVMRKIGTVSKNKLVAMLDEINR